MGYSRWVGWRVRTCGGVVVVRGCRMAIRRASVVCRSAWCRRRRGRIRGARSASGGLRRSRRARARPGEPAMPRAWVRSTELRVQYPILGHAEPHRRGARSGKLGQPRGRPGYRAPVQKTVHQPSDRSCEARVVRPAGGRPGAAARVLASLLRDWRGGWGGSRDHGQACALRSGSQPQQRVRRHARLATAWPTNRIRGRETSSFARCALGWLAYWRRDSSARSRLVH